MLGFYAAVTRQNPRPSCLSRCASCRRRRVALTVVSGEIVHEQSAGWVQ
jgi:uncharacterized protein YuzB (UPF0349 family)